MIVTPEMLAAAWSAWDARHAANGTNRRLGPGPAFKEAIEAALALAERTEQLTHIPLISTWDARFLTLATHVAGWSKDPSTKVGAVIVRPNRTVASIGFNGFPRGCDDDYRIYEDREEKYRRIVHAEANAILAAGEPLGGCTLYVAPLHPCSNCAGLIIQAGIRRVVFIAEGTPERWEADFAASARMFREAGVETLRLPFFAAEAS